MIRIVTDILNGVFDHVVVAGGDIEKLEDQGLVCYPDPVPGKGALGGIYNWLINSDSEFAFFCGCDMPLVKPDVIRVILDNIGDEDLLMPVINGIRQPLHAVYKRSILPAMERLVNSNDRFLPDLLKEVGVCYLDEHIFLKLPDYHISFVNLNSLDAITRYKSWLERL